MTSAFSVGTTYPLSPPSTFLKTFPTTEISAHEAFSLYGARAMKPYVPIFDTVVSNTRTIEQKKALFRRIAQLLGESPGVRPEDVFVSLVEVAKENWSLGHGLAQYA